MKNIYFYLLLILPSSIFSQTKEFIVKYHNPTSVHTTKGYSQSVEIDLGNCRMVVISGQIALDNKGNLVGKNNLEKQTEQVFKNIKHLIEESGGTMDHIIRIGIFMTDISQVQAMREVRNKFFNQQKPPTSTLVEVSKLVRDDLLIEIEATGILPKNN